METIKLVLEVLKIVIPVLVTAIPSIIVIIRKCKEASKAKTEAEKVSAMNDVVAKAKEFIKIADKAYSDVNELLKKTNAGSAGVFKKESVQAKLEAYSSKKGYSFTEEELSDIIENEVTFSKEVNGKS